MTTESSITTAAQMVIGGQPVEAADGQTFDITNPADGQTFSTAPQGGAEDVERAVTAARAAFDDPKGWSRWAAGKRQITSAILLVQLPEQMKEGLLEHGLDGTSDVTVPVFQRIVRSATRP